MATIQNGSKVVFKDCILGDLSGNIADLEDAGLAVYTVRQIDGNTCEVVNSNSYGFRTFLSQLVLVS